MKRDTHRPRHSRDKTFNLQLLGPFPLLSSGIVVIRQRITNSTAEDLDFPQI